MSNAPDSTLALYYAALSSLKRSRLTPRWIKSKLHLYALFWICCELVLYSSSFLTGLLTNILTILATDDDNFDIVVSE